MTDSTEDSDFQMLKDKVFSAIAKQKSLPEDMITMESTFESLGVDSLDALEILFELEEDLELDIPDTAARALKNVGDVVRGLQRLQAGEEIEIPEEEDSESESAAAPTPDAQPKTGES